MFAGVRLSGRLVILGVLALIAVSIPASAQTGPQDSPTLSVSDRLDDRRYVTTGTRAYEVGTEAGRYPAMGFHTRGEMGHLESSDQTARRPMVRDRRTVDRARHRVHQRLRHVKMELPDQGGMSVSRTDFVPDGKRAILIALTFEAGGTDQNFTLKMDAHSELMGAYPWGETNPSQTVFNLEDTVVTEGDNLVFREQGTPPTANALPHDWAAVVGSNLTPTGSDTGDDFRGPQDPPVICPPSGPGTLPAPPRCDDTAYGKGKGGQLRYDVTVPANATETVWFAVAGADFDGENPADAKAEALAEHEAVLANPEALLETKISERLALRKNTELTLPSDERVVDGIDWSKQNLADSVQVAEDLEIRETNAGKNYPMPEGGLAQMRFLGAGFPDYPWLFGTDGEYTAFASVGVGQFEEIKDHLRALRRVSLIDNGNSGKVVHEVVTDGAVFLGSNADAGNTDETAKFPSAVALIWRWTGDNRFRDEMYGFAKSNMEYIFSELDDDKDGWPEGLGNVDLQLDPPDEQPGAMPEIAPSEDYGRSIDRPFNERAMVLQAWGAYGTIWPVVHQWLGVRPDLGRRALEVVPQVPTDSPEAISGKNIRLGHGSVAVSANVIGDEYTTTVTPDVALREEIVSVTLGGEPVEDYRVRRTNRGMEILVKTATSGEQTLVITTA
jgi:hypothetical protein